MPDTARSNPRRALENPSELDMHGDTPMRVRPEVGDWGPRLVPSTRDKRRERMLVPVVFALVMVALIAAGWVFYLQVK